MDMNNVTSIKNTRFSKKQLIALSTVVLFISFLGYILECSYLGIRHHFMDNRGMVFPFLIGYGLSFAFVYVLLGLPSDPYFLCRPYKSKKYANLRYYLSLILIISVGEYMVGYTVQKLTGLMWWDYTHIPLHFGHFTSIPTSAGFALVAFLVMKYAFSPICNVAYKLYDKNRHHIIIILMVLITIDFLFSAYYLFTHGHTFQLWHANVDNTGIHDWEIVEPVIRNMLYK